MFRYRNLRAAHRIATSSGIRFYAILIAGSMTIASPELLYGQTTKYAHSDSNARYIHHIDLYDIHNRKITPESDQPYSSLNTCGRCHDYETISHGWHFNAFMNDTVDGRVGEPWIWTDPRTGTQLPLSYRDWKQTFNPQDLGISHWDMTHQFGSRVPGGGFAVAPQVDGDAAETSREEARHAATSNRWPLSGSLQIDCMVCHASSGVYDFNSRREQIEDENFAWAATAGIRLGTVKGSVSRIKDDADPADESTQQKLPKVTYDPRRFELDGTVFMDLVRQPSNNACFQCHSQQTVTDQGIELRWMHDEDVHLRAGMQCVDCHRNGIEHHTTRGFAGESNPSSVSATTIETLSCSGCHMGSEQTGSSTIASRPGRLGAPFPHHAGLPPLHFEKLACTACHGGPLPREQAMQIMTSLSHSLGSKDHRTGLELPSIAGPIYSKGDDGKIYPQRALWPAFWGTFSEGKIQPLDPATTYDLTRKSLRVRRDFVKEIIKPKLSSSERKKILGDERAKAPETELTPAEHETLAAAQNAAGRELFHEKVSASLAAIEKELNVETAVYVSSGFVYRRTDEGNSLSQVPRDEIKNTDAIEMMTWPIAHNVRPAGWSLGAGGCTECHSEQSAIFASTVQSIGPGPDQGERITMASLQGLDPNQTLMWNQLFAGRASFKYIMATSIALLCLILLVGVGALASRFTRRNHHTV
ncbi:hypothetical protein Pla52o_09330 [Novipirellula galeiformis]|uniref:Cytochrome c-552/4 domain-containing protein n=2 Tax=Novipirellula galeiformis TaxID=2528004 RepID=A0A5C6CTW3_9BACT|nr:hypothetical protein Pla52o_09330 [Novipirellula galeiformis]